MINRPTAIFLATALCVLPLTAQSDEEEAEKERVVPRVEKPIGDTYVPLEGAPWNHRLSPEIQTLREYQEQQAEKERKAARERRRSELESRIQAPDPGAPGAAPEPVIEETPDSLRIRDPE